MRNDCKLTQDEIRKVIHLLRTTELQISVIAKRFRVYDAVISKVNAEHGIRPAGKKWSLNE